MNPEPGRIAARMRDTQERQRASELAQQLEREQERQRMRDNRGYDAKQSATWLFDEYGFSLAKTEAI